MSISKKSTEEFINDVILPIEQNDVGKGNLFVLIKSQPDISFTEYEDDSPYGSEHWSLPTEYGPGNWIEGESIKLESLAGIIWRGSGGGRLYRAEFKGEMKRFVPREIFGPLNDYQKQDVEAKRRINETMSLGVEAKKARLIRRIENWRPYFLWCFALDCVERAYTYERDLLPDIYREGIIFARAYCRYRCGMGEIELEGLLKSSSTSKDFASLALNKVSQLTKLISERSEMGMTVYLQKAVLEAFRPYKPFQIANFVRTAAAWHYMREYREEYTYPSLSEIGGDQAALNRIWYALHKKELVWQVHHMNKLLGY